MKRLLLLLLFVGLTARLAFGSITTDSLATLVRLETKSTNKLNLLLQLCELHRSYAIDSLYVYSGEAIKVSKQINSPSLYAKAKFFRGVYYYRVSKIDSLNATVAEVKNILLKTSSNPNLLNGCGLLLAGGYMKKNRQKEAMMQYYEVLEKATEVGDSLSYFTAINGVGWSNMELNRYDDAISWFHKGIKTPASYHVERNKISMYTNIASCYGSIGKLNIARRYVNEGLELAKKHNDIFSIHNGLNILGNIYISEGKTNEAITCLTQTADMRKRIGDPFFTVSDMSQLAKLYASKKEYAQAIQLVKGAVQLAKEKNIDAKLPFLYNTLSEIYYQQGNYQDAYIMLSQLNVLKDERYQNVPAKELEELQLKYETSVKENTIQKQRFELSRKNYLLFGVVCLLLLSSILGFVIYKNSKNKQTIKLQAALAKEREDNAKAILEVEDKERTRFAVELHDGLGPMLSAVKYNLSGISAKMNTLNEEDKSVFEKTMKILDESCREVRQVSHSIMPNALLKNGLVNAIRDFVSKIDNSKLLVQLNISQLDRSLDPKVEIAVYRIIQECVSNVIKHAEATKLNVSMLQDEDGLSIAIEDNGKGFDVSQVNYNGIGLNNIATRVRYLQGTFEVDSRPGNGSLIIIHIP